MAVSSEFVAYALEQLSGLGGVTSRRMFGGVGVYRHGAFFALISQDVLYFKVGDHNRDDYVARGMGPFRPYADKPEWSMSYFEVPADVLEDPDECTAWARRSLIIATVKAAPVKPRR